jgi:hypothetical protein
LNTQARPFNKAIFALFVLCSLTAIFCVPYFVPQSPSTSQAWIFGYNNRVGALLVLASVFVGVVWTRGLSLAIPKPGASDKIPRKVFIATLIVYLGAGILMWWFAGRYGGFGESFYFIDRAWLIEHGQIPYKDFEYCFGISFLYGPIALEHLLRVSLLSAYHIYWILNLLVSVGLSFAILNRINFPTPSRLLIYLILVVPAIAAVLNMGVNYAGPRFQFPIYFVLVMRSLFEGAETHRRIRAIIFAVCATAFMFLFSAETPFALAFTAICLYWLNTPKWSRGMVAVFAGMMLALTALFLALVPTHLLDTIKTDGAGANSFPIALSPPILFYLAILFFCGCYLYRRIREQTVRDDLVALIVYSIPMIAGALGRCDPGHIGSNGSGLVLASLFYASTNKRVWRAYLWVFIPFMVVLPLLAGLAFSKIQIQQAAQMNASHTNPNDEDLSKVYPEWSGDFFVPVGFRPNGIGIYLSSRVDYGRYDGLQNMNTVPAVSETVEHMRMHPEQALLLPDHFDDFCEIHPFGEKLIISLLFETVYLHDAVHPNSIRKPICDYIHANYVVAQPASEKNFKYGLRVRQTERPAFQRAAMP